MRSVNLDQFVANSILFIVNLTKMNELFSDRFIRAFLIMLS